MEHRNKQKRPVETVETAFELVEIVRRNDGIRFSDLVEELGLAKSTVHRHAETLLANGFLSRRDGEYHVGLRFLDYGIHAREYQAGYELAKEKARELADETGELCIFMVEEAGRGYLLCREKGHNAVETGTRVGKPVYLHATGGGKAILSQYSTDHTERILDHWGLPARTETTVTDREVLFEELEEIRSRGYALNREEHISGLQTVAAPIVSGNGEVFGSLCVSGPTNRMTGTRFEEEIPNLLLGAVNELELNLTYS